MNRFPNVNIVQTCESWPWRCGGEEIVPDSPTPHASFPRRSDSLWLNGLAARPKASLLGKSVAIWSFRWRIRSGIWRGTWRSREVGDSCISFWTPFHENLIQCLQKIFLDIKKIEPWKGPKQSITFYKFEGKIQNFHTLSVPSQFERIILYFFF